LKIELLLLFIGMALVTYIPRVFPFYSNNAIVIDKRLEKPLKLLPCAAIGALIFPQGLLIYENALLVSPIALIVGALVTWFSENIPLGIFSTILLTFILL